MDMDWDQHGGVILRREALAMGYDDHTIYANVRRGVWVRVRMGAYTEAERWAELDEVGRHRVRARAVLKTAHPSAVLTHVSSVLEHGAPVWGVDLTEVHVTRTDGKRGRREAGVVHHHGSLHKGEVEVINGVHVSQAGRSAIELTTMASVESSLVSVNWLLHHEMTTREELEDLLVTCRHWPGSLRSDLVVRLADGRNAWPGEARTSHLLWREHVPAPEPQYGIYVDGHLVGVVDFAWPDFKVFVEFDGRIKYARLRRPGESLEDVILREKRREEAICRLTGWVCLRISWEDLARPATTARRIRSMLASRALHPA